MSFNIKATTQHRFTPILVSRRLLVDFYESKHSNYRLRPKIVQFGYLHSMIIATLGVVISRNLEVQLRAFHIFVITLYSYNLLAEW